MNRCKSRDPESVRVPRRRNLVRVPVNDLAAPSPRRSTPTQSQSHPSREGRQSEQDGSTESGSASDSSGESDVSNTNLMHDGMYSKKIIMLLLIVAGT